MLKHRLRLNRKAPPLGYEYPFQVLKLHWQRNDPDGSPWASDVGNESIIQKFEVEPDEVLSNELDYDPILGAGLNKAVTLHAVRFEEVEPESGFDDHVRYEESLRFDLPWLAVANSKEPGDSPKASVKIHFSPPEQELNLDVETDGGHSATVTPDKISGNQPVTLTITGSNDFGETENQYTGRLRIEEVGVLELAFYKRRVVNLAVHEITKTNDDENEEYPAGPGEPDISIEPGKGKPDTICIAIGPGKTAIFSSPNGDSDDYYSSTHKAIMTGEDGIRQTVKHEFDAEVIPMGQGEPNAVIVNPGPNGELNTAPNSPGGFLEDDEIVGSTITTGPDGIRQTPEIDAAIAPVNVPTQQELQDHLDWVFGRQANIWFDIVEWNTENAAYDVASTQEEATEFPVTAQPNRKFDFYISKTDSEDKPVLTKEEQIVQAASWNSEPGTINLYYLGSRIQMLAPILGIPDSSLVGHARALRRSPYFAAFDPVFPPGSPGQLSKFKLLHGGAHEIGHNDLFGEVGRRRLAHPWKNKLSSQNGPPVENDLVPNDPVRNHTLVDQQFDRMKLMWLTLPENLDPVTGRSPSRLLKHEVDTLHEANSSSQ